MRNGERVSVAWIPIEFARVGRVLRIGVEDGWRVTKTYSDMVMEDLDRQRKTQRDRKRVLGS